MEVESELEPVIHNAPSPASIEPPAINADIPGAAATTSSTSRTSPQIASAASSPATSTRSLKRSAEMMEEDDNNDTNNPTNENDTEDRQETKRKRLSTDEQDEDGQPSTSDSASKNKDSENAVASTSKAAVSQEVVGDGTNAAKLVEEMGMELTCGCCTEMCYNPVIVLPCQHYYCGSCYTLWTRNGGVNCPSCRSPVTSIIPSRAIQSLVDVYLRAVPSRTRLVREKEQADEIYVAGQSIPVPTPRPRSPELTAPQDNDAYYHPCPHCASPNDFNWSCPVPIISPAVNLTFATLLTAPIFPAGHARCGSCEHIHAPRAPTSSKCDFCLQSFCGLVVPTRCHAKRVREQRPITMDSLMDILGNPDVYEAFAVNAVEFDYLLDYLTSKEISPRHIYAEIAEPLTSTVDGWRPLLDRGIFPAVTEAERAAPPAPISPARNEAPPQEQQSSQSASPDTAVDESVPAETQPSGQDREMTDAVPGTTETTSEVRPPEPPAESVVPVITPEAQVADITIDSSRDSEMIVDAAVRSPTPITVPEPVPTPPVPEPTLDALPVDVEVQQPSEPPAIPPTTEADTPEQVVVITSSGNNNSIGENDADDDDESTSERSVSPPPASNPNESTRTNANATSSSASSRSRGPHLNKICRTCAAEVFFWGARAWWIKERAKARETGELPENVRSRKDCPDLGRCDKEDDNAHAREFNHIPHPPQPAPSTSTTTAPTEAQPSDTNNTADPEQPTDASPIVPPATDDATANETSDSSNVVDATEAQERTSSPERPSRSGSAAEGERMDVDAPAPVEPVETTNEARLSLLSVLPGASAENEDHEMENTSSLEPELESPENSLPSSSSGLGGLVAGGSGVDGGPLDGSGEYSEKVMSALGGSGDVHMVLHGESEPPITSTSARAA